MGFIVFDTGSFDAPATERSKISYGNVDLEDDQCAAMACQTIANDTNVLQKERIGLAGPIARLRHLFDRSERPTVPRHVQAL
jgi:hypothetical protein